MSVESLLRDSVTAHRRAAQFRRERKTQLAAETLENARTLRLEALALDPQREDPAWADEPAPHDSLMAFYESKLGAVE